METPKDEKEIHIEIPDGTKVIILDHAAVKDKKSIINLHRRLILEWEDMYNLEAHISDNQIFVRFLGEFAEENLKKLFSNEYLEKLYKAGFKMKFWS